jgi:hypothetical protein
MLKRFKRFVLDPHPLRSLAIETMQRFDLGRYETRLQLSALERPHYGYIVYHAAALAKKLGLTKISVLEFGVAGGNGLVNLEYHAQQVAQLFGVEIEIYGFDTGAGLPAPEDYRDLPYHWKSGFFKMDVTRLQERLQKSKLVLGDIRQTAKNFFADFNPAPIGAVSHDFDFYSSTAAALQLFDAEAERFLPRVFCYFDDTLGSEMELYNDYTGERLAINEFNEQHGNIKLGMPYHLLARKIVEPWYHQIRICHFFAHRRYNDFVSDENQQLQIQL